MSSSICSLCHSPAHFTCFCSSTPISLCKSHLSTHIRYPGIHRYQPLTVSHDYSEIVEWLKIKVKQERETLEDKVNEHYCQMTRTLFALYAEMKVEMQTFYTTIEAEIQQLQSDLSSHQTTPLTLLLPKLTSQLNTASLQIINLYSTADSCISCTRLPLPHTPSLLSLLEEWTRERNDSIGDMKLMRSAQSLRVEKTRRVKECSHWGRVRTNKAFECCKRLYACAQCHDKSESHTRSALLFEVCVMCGEKVNGVHCPFCSI